MSEFRTYNIDDAKLVSAVAQAMSKGEKSVIVPVSFFALTTGGLLASDGHLRVRLDVTMRERAGGALRGEDAQAVAVRETRETAHAAARAAASEITEAARAQVQAYARLSAAALAMGAVEDRKPRQFYRLRSAVMALRDGLADAHHVGLPAQFPQLTDLLSGEAWRPVFPGGAESGKFLDGVSRPEAHLDATLVERACAAATGFASDVAGAPVVWRDLATADIAAITDDHKVRHLLITAAELREQAAEFSVVDPQRAASIMNRVTDIESEAVRKAVDRLAVSGDEVESGAKALETQARM